MFVSRLESIRVKLGVAPDISSVVIRCYKYDPHNGGSVYVEVFSSLVLIEWNSIPMMHSDPYSP